MHAPTTIANHSGDARRNGRGDDTPDKKKGSLGEGIYLPSATSMFLLCKGRIQEPAESSRGCPFPPRQCPLMRCFRLQGSGTLLTSNHAAFSRATRFGTLRPFRRDP